MAHYCPPERLDFLGGFGVRYSAGPLSVSIFVHIAKYYKLRYVNPWPTPIQKSHPTIWIPGGHETMDFVARKGWVYMGIAYFCTKDNRAKLTELPLSDVRFRVGDASAPKPGEIR